MNAKRILIALMCLTIGLGIQAEESKELKKLLKAVRKVTNREKSGDKEVAEAEKALQLVIEKHPEEAGKAHVYFADIYVFSKNKELHDETKALKLYRQSIKELAPDDKLLGFACNRMGIFFQEGKVVPQNFDSAYVYFEKAQEIDKKQPSCIAVFEKGSGQKISSCNGRSWNSTIFRIFRGTGQSCRS